MTQARKIVGPHMYFNVFDHTEPSLMSNAGASLDGSESDFLCPEMIKALRGPRLYRHLLAVKFAGRGGSLKHRMKCN